MLRFRKFNFVKHIIIVKHLQCITVVCEFGRFDIKRRQFSLKQDINLTKIYLLFCYINDDT